MNDPRAKSMIRVLPTWCLLVAAALSPSGCGALRLFQPSPDPTRFYLLAARDKFDPGAPLDPSITVGLGPIDLPEYLLRPEVVVRQSVNEIVPSPFDRWSEPIDRGVARVLTQDLAGELGLARVVSFPWYANQLPDYQVRVQFRSFDLTRDGEVHVEARWEITKLRDKATATAPGKPDPAAAIAAAKLSGKPPPEKQRVSWDSNVVKRVAMAPKTAENGEARTDTADAVAAMSDGLGDVAHEMAAAVRGMALP